MSDSTEEAAEQPEPEATEQPEPEATEQPEPEATEQPEPEGSQSAAEDSTTVLPAVETAEVTTVIDPVTAPAAAAEVTDTPAEIADTPAKLRRSWLGLWSVALSVLGLGVLPIFGSVLGIVLARLALRRGPGYRVIGGRPLAMVGFWLGTATLAVFAIAVATYALVTAFAAV